MKRNFIFIILLSIVFSTVLFGQNNNKKIIITGVVLDANQNPVIDAIIVIDNKKTNCSTDNNGFYKVKVKPSAEKIGIFTFDTIASEEIINGRKTINFTLVSSNLQQKINQNNTEDEEVIDIGYGTVEKKNMTSSSSRIGGQNKRNASYSNIFDMIRGKVPGVQVSGRNIKIQGTSSINSGTAPLLIVNGVAVNSIDNIQPNMVKSIEVLKGAAASIYGSRGANDVLQSEGDIPLWYGQVDQTNTTIWAQFKGTNPNEQLVEINVRQTVFYPDKPGMNYITVHGFTMSDAATPWAPPTAEQIGLIGTHWSKDWIIENNVISYSVCSGIALGKYGDEWDNKSANSAEGYVNTIERALKNGSVARRCIRP